MPSERKVMLKILNPASGELVTELETDDSISIIEKFNRAMAKQLEWVNSSLEDRESIVRNFEYKLQLQKNILAENLALESGKIIRDCFDEIDLAMETSSFFRHHFRRTLKPQKEINRKNNREYVSYEPLGVIAHIASSDLPIFTAVSVIIPALLTGNTVLFKPGEYASLSGLAIVELLFESGLPDEVVIPVLGGSFAGQELLKWPLNGIFFSGSYKTGRAIADICSRRFTKLQMELGGNNAIYVCDDYDIPKAARQITIKALYQTGQSRINPGRVFVSKSIYNEFIDALTVEFQNKKFGDPMEPSTDIGPMTRESNFEEIIQNAVSQGAVASRFQDGMPENGNFVAPAILKDVTEDMDFFQNENIGPLLGVMAVSSDIEAIHYINDSDYGLCASIFTNDDKRADMVLSNVQTGLVCRNCCGEISPYLPRNGRKESGSGTSMGLAGLRNFVRPRSWIVSD